jgi:hypothetical protein
MAALFDIVIALMIISSEIFSCLLNLVFIMSTFEPISILALLKSLERPKEQKSFEDGWKSKVNSNSPYGTSTHPCPGQTAC